MNTSRFIHHIVYVTSFGLGRGILFGAPFLLANFLPNSDYGQLETALVISTLVASIATMGTSNAVPIVVLGHNKKATIKGITTHHLLIVAVSLIVFFLVSNFSNSKLLLLIALLIPIIALQNLASIRIKTLGYGEASVFIDTGLLSVLAISAALTYYFELQEPFKWIVSAIFVYLICFVCLHFWALLNAHRIGETVAWKKTLNLGVPLMLGTLVSLLAASSGRLGVGILGPSEMMAEFAVLARAGALPIIAHQLILIAMFRNLFSLPTSEVELSMIKIIIFVFFSAIFFIIFAPYLNYVLGPAFTNAYTLYREEYFLITAQSILWSAISLNDLLISRNQLMLKVIPYTLVCLGSILLLGYITVSIKGISIEFFVFIHSIIMLIFYVSQLIRMNYLGVQIKKKWVTTLILYFIAILAPLYLILK